MVQPKSISYLTDSYNTLAKAEYYNDLLLKYGEILKEKESQGAIIFNQAHYKEITNIKFEVCALCRLK